MPIGLLLIGYSTFTLSLPTESQPIHFYSSETRDDLKKVFSACIETAEKTLAISSYGYSDSDILALLRSKQNQGVALTLYQLSAKKKRGLRHRKFLIADEKLICLSSVNLTEPSLTVHNNLAILLLHPALASHLLTSTPYQDPLLTYYPLPHHGKEALGHLLSLLNNATHSIHLAIFTLTHPLLVDALIAAAARGVEVDVTLDKQNGKAASKKALGKLEAAGIVIYQNKGNQLFHHKCAWIDEKTFLFGSANWTKSAFEYNDEDFLILHHLTKEQRKFCAHFFTSIRYT